MSMALTYSSPGKLGSIPPDFNLPGVDGRSYRLSDFKDSRALVLVFMCNHCPYVIATQDRINQLTKDYSPRGVSVVGINSNDAIRYPDDSFEQMKKRAKEKNFAFPYLVDESQEVAKAYGAVCTPEFFVYGATPAGFQLQYLGRLDDNWKDSDAVSRRDLAEALEAILAGRKPSTDQKSAMGCSIKWK